MAQFLISECNQATPFQISIYLRPWLKDLSSAKDCKKPSVSSAQITLNNEKTNLNESKTLKSPTCWGWGIWMANLLRMRNLNGVQFKFLILNRCPSPPPPHRYSTQGDALGLFFKWLRKIRLTQKQNAEGPGESLFKGSWRWRPNNKIRYFN